MRSRRGSFHLGIALIPAVFLALQGGCPAANNDGAGSISQTGSTISGAPFSSAGSSSGGSTQTAGSSSTNNAVRNGTSFSDGLTAKYADCLSPVDEDALREEIFDLVNKERAAQGLGAVTPNNTLQSQAEEYACELIHYDYFAHVNPVTQSTLSDRAEQFGYSYRVVGENLAAGQQSAIEAFNDWMNSPGHRANILDPRFVELGVAIRSGGSYGLYWVQEFGQPLHVATQPNGK